MSTKEKKYRVIQWATGQVGIEALRGIIEHPDLELVGLMVYSESKEGKNAAELCGLDASTTDVRATRDVDSLLTLDADCVCYTATDTMRRDEGLDDMCKLLAAGVNVVSINMVAHSPSNFGDEVVTQITDACDVGGTSIYGTGVLPGITTETMLLGGSSASQRIDVARAYEYIELETYLEPDLFPMLGVGKPLEEAEELGPIMEMDEHHFWGTATRGIAHGFGVEVDEIRHSREFVVAKKTFEGGGVHIEEGTVEAMHLHFDVVVDGEIRITQDCFYWFRGDFFPNDWPEH